MSDTPFTPPASDADDRTDPKGLTLLTGGRVPPIGTLFQQTMDEFMANLGPYAMAGLGLFVTLIPIIIVMVGVIYIGMFGILFAGIFGAVGVAQLLPQDAAGPVAVLIQILSMGLAVAVMLGLIGGMNLLIAPMNASLLRAVREQQQGGKKLDFMAVFRTFTTDLGKVLAMTLLGTGLAMIGVLMCYFPAFIVAFVLVFATSLVALHRRGAVDAARISVSHTFAQPGFHLMFFFVYIGVSLLASYVPVIGPMFAYALLVRTHRELFGDGEEPVVG